MREGSESPVATQPRSSSVSFSQMAPSRLTELLRSNVSLRLVQQDIYSVLSTRREGASYDSRAALYDWIVGSRIYNRLMWGVSTAHYQAFVRRALASGSGPFLDAGAGSAVFTAEAYARAERPIVLVDRSRGMLEAARTRIVDWAGGAVPDHVTLLQADVQALPFQDETVGTILSMGMLHLFEDVTGHVQKLLRVLEPGGELFATSLVAERVVGRRYLQGLHKAGEVATPKRYDALRQVLTAAIDRRVESEREGSMAFFRIQ